MTGEEDHFNLISFSKIKSVAVRARYNLIFAEFNKVAAVKFAPDPIAILVEQIVPNMRIHLCLQKRSFVFMAVNLVKLIISVSVVKMRMGVCDNKRHTAGNFVAQTFEVSKTETGINKKSFFRTDDEELPQFAYSVQTFFKYTVYIISELIYFAVGIHGINFLCLIVFAQQLFPCVAYRVLRSSGARYYFVCLYFR